MNRGKEPGDLATCLKYDPLSCLGDASCINEGELDLVGYCVESCTGNTSYTCSKKGFECCRGPWGNFYCLPPAPNRQRAELQFGGCFSADGGYQFPIDAGSD